jgi:iron complex outermembrane recepter protein
MKRFLLLAWPVMLPFLAMGQFTLSGKISDIKTGEALPGTIVQIENTFIATSCDADGKYKISNLKKGNYNLTVSYLGYKTQKQKLDITGDLKLDITLEQSPVMQEEVVINATRASEKSPTTYENIGKTDILKLNLGQDMPYILDNTPSAVVSSDAGAGIGYTGIRIRGTDITRINVTMNGIPVNDPESQGVFWVNMPDFTSSVDNIQIQRGVGTSTNGPAAFGASINIQTLKLIPEAYAESNNSYGSFNTWKNNILLGTGLINGKWTFDGRLSRISSDGYIDRASSNLRSFYLSGAYFGEKQYFKINILQGKEKTYQAWNGVPKDSLKTNRTYNPFTYENQTDNYRQDHYQFFYGRELSNKWNMNLALHYTRGKGYYEELQDISDPWAHTAYADYGLPNLIIGADTLTNTSLIRQKWLDNHFYGLTFSVLYDNRKNIKLTLGGAANQYLGHHYGFITWAQYYGNNELNYEWYRGQGIKTDMNLFAKFEYLLGKHLNLFADAQYRFVNHDISGTDGNMRILDINKTFHFFNPKAGIFYKFNDKHQAYLSLALTNREPNRNNFADADPSRLPVPEQLYDIESGYYFTHTKLKLSADLFYMYYKNQLVLTGEINDVGYSIMTNVPVSYRTGLEIAVSFLPKKWFRWDINLAYTINKIKDFTEYVDVYDTTWNYSQQINHLGTTDIAFSPAIVGGSQMNFTLCKGLELSLINKYVGKQFIDNTSSNDRMLKAFVLHNAMITYSIHTKFIKTIELKFALNNFLNKKYENNAWVYRYIYDGADYTDDGYFPQAGINFMSSINLKF